MINQPTLEIGYKKVFPIVMLLSSLFILYVALIVGFTINTITGLVLLPVSILMLTRPVISMTPNEIQMKNLWGMVVKKYSYTRDRISLRNNSVYVDEKKVFSTWWANRNIKAIEAFLMRNGSLDESTMRY
jgi:hypothetical protein